MPEIGDHLRISCSFRGVVRDVYTVYITKVSKCLDETDTVLIQIAPPTIDRADMNLQNLFEVSHSNSYQYH